MARKPTNVVTPRDSSNFIARVICPWCGVLTSGPVVPVVMNLRLPDNRWHSSVTFKCGDYRCGRATLLVHEGTQGLQQTDNPVIGHPALRSQYAPEGVLQEIAKDFREAQDARALGFLFAASLVGRRVLQAAIRNVEGVGTRENLRAEIEAVPVEQLPRTLKDAAHEVRFTGNDAAHVDDVTEAEVDDLLEFTESVLDALYVIPARVHAAAARRKNK